MKRAICVAALLVASLLTPACSEIEALVSPPTPIPVPRGILVNPPQKMPDFTLTDHNGRQVRLSDLTRDSRAVMLFFGYTHCPDVCPISMGDFIAYKRALGDAADKVRFVMISVDGERDDPQTMKQYVTAFDSEFVGLTGPEQEVRQIGLPYGVYFEKRRPQGTQASYLITHTAYSYLVDAALQWRMVFPFRADAELVAEDIRKILDKQ
ncbi:MAG: SCO family protein [Anaerolineae bacterium]